jgi:hypothetical protein
MPIILATQEAEIRKVKVQGQPEQIVFKTLISSWSRVAHACNPSYSGARDQEDQSLKPAQANSSQDLFT